MKRATHLLSCLALLVCFVPIIAKAQQPESLALDKPIDLHVRKATLTFVLGWLSVQQKIPIGIEFSTSEKHEPKLNIDVNKTPLVEVLNLITHQEPAYLWEVRDGVVNFTPVQSRDNFFKTLLDTRIRSFESPKGNNKFAIREALLNAPEIKDLIISNGAKADELTYPHKPSIYANSAELSDTDTTLRSLLNKIIRDSEHNSWTLQWVDKKQRVFELGF